MRQKRPERGIQVERSIWSGSWEETDGTCNVDNLKQDQYSDYFGYGQSLRESNWG